MDILQILYFHLREAHFSLNFTAIPPLFFIVATKTEAFNIFWEGPVLLHKGLCPSIMSHCVTTV